MKRIRTLFLALALAAGAGSALAQEKTAGDRVDDTWLHTKVKTALATNQGMSINIEVYKGEVQLAGFTTDPELQKSIPDHAARVEGVKKVYNQLLLSYLILRLLPLFSSLFLVSNFPSSF